MQRTAMCRVCQCFVTAEKRDLLPALRDHALDNLDTHRMAEITAVDVDAAFAAIIGVNAPWTRAA